MTLGPNVSRFFRQGTSGQTGCPDRAETRTVAGFVRAVSAVRGFRDKSLGENDGGENGTGNATDDDFPQHFIFCTDSTDCPDIPSVCEVFFRQGTAPCPDKTAPCPDKTPPWHDDREWLFRWRRAGTTLASRELVLRAWLALPPPQPLPRRLPSLELARIARQHGVTVEIEPHQGNQR